MWGRAGKLQEAEKLWLTVAEPDLAIIMYKNQEESVHMLVNDNIPPEDPDTLSSLALTSCTRKGLRQLNSMGLTNVKANLQALRMAQDNVDQAYILLVEQKNSPIAVTGKPVSVSKLRKKE
ncbi:hypothetical protein BC829DRAFT_414410 [Chytridium lagenaria]|nr:hypothetical protein BC829DRAFT_414410 [Chytridium lagenaria]